MTVILATTKDTPLKPRPPTSANHSEVERAKAYFRAVEHPHN